MYLLDTNHCSYILNGIPAVTERFRQIDKAIIATCVIVHY
jgi:predicted nucleic acid-binding protein